MDTITASIESAIKAVCSDDFTKWTLTPRLFLQRRNFGAGGVSFIEERRQYLQRQIGSEVRNKLAIPSRNVSVRITRSCLLKNPPKRLECPVCKKPYGFMTKLRYHSYTHLNMDELKERNVKYHECPKCQKIFFAHHLYEKHLKSHEDKVPMNLNCPKCPPDPNRRFLFSSLLRNHFFDHLACRAEGFKMIKEEGKDARKKCPICRTLFLSYSQLNSHLLEGHVERFSDVVPRNKSKSKSGAASSSAAGGGVKKKIRNRNAPIIPEFNITCSVPSCGLVFLSKFDLKEHLQTHIRRNDAVIEMESPAPPPKPSMSTPTIAAEFKCVECQKDFQSNNDLLRHKRVVHQGLKIFQKGNKNFPCSKCKLVFKFKTLLNNHLLKAHSKK